MNKNNKGTIRQIFDGIALVSGLKCAYGELVQFPKADQLVNIFGLVVSINKYNYSKVILFGSTFLLKVGDQVDNTFNNLKIYIGSHFLGTVLNGIGQYIDIKETKFQKNVWANHYIVQNFKTIIDNVTDAKNNKSISVLLRKRLDWIQNAYYDYFTNTNYSWLSGLNTISSKITIESEKAENNDEIIDDLNENSFFNLSSAESKYEEGKGATSDVETKAPHIMDRSVIDRAVITGLKVVDCLFPIGKGQRQLILGDKQSGKTTLAYLVMTTQAKLNSYYTL